MYRPCYAPVFAPSDNSLACFARQLALILLLILLIVFLAFTFGSEGVMCLIRRSTFRIQNCKEGNEDPEIDIGFTVDRWIRETPTIRDAIIWRPDDRLAVGYPDWPREDKALLASLYEILRDGGTLAWR